MLIVDPATLTAIDQLRESVLMCREMARAIESYLDGNLLESSRHSLGFGIVGDRLDDAQAALYDKRRRLTPRKEETP